MLKHVCRHPARSGALFLLCALLSGCGNEPPGCADEKTVALVKETFWSTVARNAVEQDEKALLAIARPNFDVTVELPSVLGKQSDAGKLMCAADLKVKLGAEAAKSVDRLFRRESGASVGYSSQITADGKEHVVEVTGLDLPVEYVWSLTKMGAFKASQPDSGNRRVALTPASPATLSGQNIPVAAAAGPTVQESSGMQESPASAAARRSAEAAYHAADKALNDAYQAARARLPEARGLTLRDEQRGWIKRRNEACSAEAIKTEIKGVAADSTAMESERLSCMTKVTQERTAQLIGK